MELLLDVLLIRVNSQIKLYFKKANAHFSCLCVLFFHTIPFDFPHDPYTLIVLFVHIMTVITQKLHFSSVQLMQE